MFRIVRLPDGKLFFDENGKAPGRGIYLCRSASCISLARKRSSLERSLNADSDPELYERLEDLIGTG